MKTDSAAPTRAAPTKATDKLPQGHHAIRTGDTVPADLFAQLMSAVEVRSDATPVAEPNHHKEPNADPGPVLGGLPAAPANDAPTPTAPATDGQRGPNKTAKPAAWVSTVAKAGQKPNHTASPGESAQAAQEASTLPDPTMSASESGRLGSHGALPGLTNGAAQPARTDTETIDVALLTGLAPERASRSAHDSGAGARGGEAGRAQLDAAGPSSAQSDATGSAGFDGALADAMTAGMSEAFQALGEQVSLWAAGTTRKASLTLQTGLRETLEVDVSLDGAQTQLSFRSDDAAVREALRAYAQPVLLDMLAQAGLGLESMTVSERGADSDQHQSGSGERPGRAAGIPAAAQDSGPDAPRRLTTLQGVGLSVYA